MELLNPCKANQFAAQSASYTGTAGSVTGWPYGPDGVLVWTTTDAYISVGDAATATTTSTPVPAYTPIAFRVPPAGANGSGVITTWRVSAIQVASGGTVYAKPLVG